MLWLKKSQKILVPICLRIFRISHCNFAGGSGGRKGGVRGGRGLKIFEKNKIFRKCPKRVQMMSRVVRVCKSAQLGPGQRVVALRDSAEGEVVGLVGQGTGWTWWWVVGR